MNIRYIISLVFLLSLTIQINAETDEKRLKVGLVLGGGGAKGAAEVGVLKYIEKSGIPIDYIAGTSIGSIVGGLYACGYCSADLDSMFSSQEWTSLLSDRYDGLEGNLIHQRNGITYILGYPVNRSKKTKTESHDSGPGLLHGDNIVKLLDSMTNRPDSINFNDLPIPFRCVAVDVKRIKEVILDRGVLSTAMRASMSIPGIFKPVEKDSMLLIDGGVLNNLPVDVVRAMGADVVIAVDLTQNKHNKKKHKMKRRKGLALLLEWLRTRPDLEKYRKNIQDCEVYINPNLKGFDAMSFNSKKIKEMIMLGEKAGKDSLGKLKKLKKRVYK